MKRSHSIRRRLAIATVAGLAGVGALVNVATTASAAEEETLGNNLSVPLVIVPSASAEGLPTLRGGSCAASMAPTGPKSAQYPTYYLQKTEAVWQAECTTMSTANVTANWGDNLISRRRFRP